MSAERNILQLQRIVERLDNLSPEQRSEVSPQDGITDRQPSIIAEKKQRKLQVGWLPPTTVQSIATPSQHLHKLEQLFKKQIADLQLDLQRSLESLRRTENQLKMERQLNSKLKSDLDQLRNGEQSRLKQFRMQVEQEFLSSMSELLMKKDEELQTLNRTLQQKLTQLNEENLQLKHNIVHLKSELVGLEQAVDGLKQHRSARQELNVAVSQFCERCHSTSTHKRC